MDAALLFIDISGFTASMERFAQQGSQGIEKFWKMFNAYFCDLLEVIQVRSAMHQGVAYAPGYSTVSQHRFGSLSKNETRRLTEYTIPKYVVKGFP